MEYRNFPLDIAALMQQKQLIVGMMENQKYFITYTRTKVAGLEEVQLRISIKNLKRVVQESGFKLDFDNCISNSKIEDFILEDRIDGTKNYKIEATPTLIINGEKFENPKNYKKLKKYIEKLI